MYKVGEDVHVDAVFGLRPWFYGQEEETYRIASQTVSASVSALLSALFLAPNRTLSSADEDSGEPKREQEERCCSLSSGLCL